jgi:pimeloyl-ACP methyl ester carboxylesterase
VLLIHGAEADHGLFDPLVAALDGRVRAVTYDQRDCRADADDGDEYRLEDLADDAVQVLDELDIDAAHVVGQSVGGVIAQLVALRHPDRVNRLVLCCTYRAGESLATINPDGVAQRLAVRAHGSPRDRTALLTTDEYAAAHPGAIDAVVPATSDAQRERRLRAITTPVTADVSAIRAPTLVMAAECDRIVSVEHARALAGTIPDASFVLLPGVGHAAPLQAPAAIADTITTFIGEGP